jgi:transposase-like protein
VNNLHKEKIMHKEYTQEFKETIVELYESGQWVVQLADEYGIATTTIYKWINLFSKKGTAGVSQVDFLALKKELAQAKENNTILKKVLTIFAEKKAYNHWLSKQQISVENIFATLKVFKIIRVGYTITSSC